MAVILATRCAWPRSQIAVASCAALLWLLGDAPARALDPDTPLAQYRADAWQENAGLPQKFVVAILQTRDGYLWIGTKGGLARFDGVRFVTYDDRHPDQLRESEVWALAEGADGVLWIATYGGGLSRLAEGRITTLTTRDGLPSDFVTALAIAPDGGLWIGTEGGLCHSKAGRLTTYKQKDGLPRDAVRALHLDRRGVLWVGTTGGLASFDAGRLVNHALTQPGRLDRRVTALTGGSGDELWLASTDGLLRVTAGRAERVRLPSQPGVGAINALTSDGDGTLWIGTDGGLCRQRRGTVTCAVSELAVTPNAPRAVQAIGIGQPQALHTDREGSLWVGTRVDGLVRLTDSAFRYLSAAKNGDQNVATVIEDGRDTVWFGTGHGLQRVDESRRVAQRVWTGGSADPMVTDRHGKVWFWSSSVGGLFRMRAGRAERVAVDQLDGLVGRALLFDRRGTLWIGTDADGLFALAGGHLTHYSKKEGLLGEQVRALAEDRQGGLWIGTRDGGLTCLRDGKLTAFGREQGLSSSSVQAVFVGAGDVVWVATRHGVNRVRAGKVVTLTAESGLPANFFYQIVGDDHGALWMTFGRGIARVSEAELNAVADGSARTVSPVTFGTEDGMRSTAMVVPGQPTAWKSRDGRLWFATDRGVVVADPKTLAHNRVPPPVVIEELRVDKQPRTLNAALEFPPGQGDVEIHYAALSFVAPEKVRFRYKLEGFDSDWVEAGSRRVAYYTNLPPDRYRFRVMACNNDGVWNEAGASVSLTLRPHFFQTHWFYVLCAAFVGLLVWVGHLVRVAEVKAQFTAVLTERARIARDLHDTLAQSVVGISAQLQAVKALLVEAPAAAAEHLDLAIEMVRHTLVETRRSVWDIRSQALEGSDLAAALTEAARQLSATAPIPVRVIGAPRALPKATENHLLHIGQEALSNAVKHAEAQHVELELLFEGAHVRLTVKDDGHGFDVEHPAREQEGHFGLIGMRERVQRLGGQLAIHSAPGRGTELVVTVAVT